MSDIVSEPTAEPAPEPSADAPQQPSGFFAPRGQQPSAAMQQLEARQRRLSASRGNGPRVILPACGKSPARPKYATE